MQVFLLGASGLIGRGIAKALKARGHRVLGLSRARATGEALAGLGVEPVEGDLRQPEGWAGTAVACDALVNAAGTFSDDMGALETALADRLLEPMAAAGKRWVATGGVWLYPPAGAAQPTAEAAPATEDAPHDPTPGFEWAPALLQRVRAAGGLVVHPAAVWRRDAGMAPGVLARLLDPEMLASGTVALAGGPHVRWPLVEAADLGRLYADVLERGAPGESYLGVAEPGVPQEHLAQAVERGLGRRLGRHVLHERDLVAAEGPIAAGYARDLCMDASSKARAALGWRPLAGPAAAALERLARARR
jgi:nucleoside-diphosphate-sugar epimerase